MTDRVVHPAGGENADAMLREGLARGDSIVGTVLPILQHLLAADDSSMFSDEVLARVRGMLAGLVDDLLGTHERGTDEERCLLCALTADPVLLSHLHATALEWQLNERLQARLALDPVLSPLLKSLIASPDLETQRLAMAYLAAQARWGQNQRRMKLPLKELPGDLVYGALQAVRSILPEPAERIAQIETDIRQSYDEGTIRLGLAARLITGLGIGEWAVLSITHAGASLFLTALALRSGQGRDAVVLSTHETQIARLMLALRSTGLDAFRVEEQVLALHPAAILPSGFDSLTPDMATAVLTSGRSSGCLGA